MTDVLRLGTVVLWKPTRSIFALSSGSWTGAPANKKRPCVVVEVDNNGVPTIAPLCGAQYDYRYSQWIRRPQMVNEWWHPVKYSGVNVQVPPDGLTEVPRPRPVVITHNSAYPPPPSFPQFKPCYIWTGDVGQAIPAEDLASLTLAGPYMQMDTAEVAELKKWWELWLKLGKAPPA